MTNNILIFNIAEMFVKWNNANSRGGELKIMASNDRLPLRSHFTVFLFGRERALLLINRLISILYESNKYISRLGENKFLK